MTLGDEQAEHNSSRRLDIRHPALSNPVTGVDLFQQKLDR
jgi:hypothetical protein